MFSRIFLLLNKFGVSYEIEPVFDIVDQKISQNLFRFILMQVIFSLEAEQVNIVEDGGSKKLVDNDFGKDEAHNNGNNTNSDQNDAPRVIPDPLQIYAYQVIKEERDCDYNKKDEKQFANNGGQVMRINGFIKYFITQSSLKFCFAPIAAVFKICNNIFLEAHAVALVAAHAGVY